jgi:hypothetical protein
MNQEAFVLWWKYSDGSGMGVLRVYLDEERANSDFDLVQGADKGTKEFFIDEVPLFEK